MAEWSEEELRAAWEAAQQPKGQWSEEELYATWQAAQQEPEEQRSGVSLGKATYQVGKSLLSGAATIGDLAMLGLDALNFSARDLKALSNTPTLTEMVQGGSRWLAPKLFGQHAVDERGDVVTGDAADIAKGAVEGSVFPVGGPVMNALSGGSAVVGEKLFPDSQAAPLLFSLLPAAGTTAARSFGRLFSPKVQAGKILRANAGAEGRRNISERLASGTTEGPAGPLTYAELADTPTAAAYQQTVRKTPGAPAEIIEQAFDERQAARVRGLQRAAPDALSDVTQSERGAIVQPRAAGISKAQVARANAAYSDIPDVQGIDVLPSKLKVAVESDKLFANNPIPMDSDASLVVEAVLDGPMERSLGEIDGIRKAAGRVIGKLARADKGAPEIRLMEVVQTSLDEAMMGMDDPEALQALTAAREGRKAAGEVFQSPTIKRLTKKGDYGKGYKQSPDAAMRQALKDDQSAAEMVRAYRHDPLIMGQLRGGVIDEIATTKGAQRGYQTWPRHYAQRRDVVKQVFSSDEAAQIEAIMDDIASENRVQELASRASRGQSATQQYITAAGKLLSEGPSAVYRILGNSRVGMGGAAVMGTLGNLPAGVAAYLTSAGSKQLASAIEKWVAKGMADPQVLEMLSKRATANNVQQVAKLFVASLGAGMVATGHPGITQPTGEIGYQIADEQQDQQAEDAPYNQVDQALEVGNDGTHKLLPDGSIGLDITFDDVMQEENDMGSYDEVAQRLVPAIIAAESAGEPAAISPKGAMGLMQIMPATWDEWAPRAGVEGADPLDPEANQAVGTAYLGWLLEQFEGDVPSALAAYNWGIGNVQRLLQRENARTVDDIRDRLPRETRDYLAKITT